MSEKSQAAAFEVSTVKIASGTLGWDLDAWKYVPNGEGPHAVIVMAHGLSANKRMALATYAETFANAGIACVVFDYRRWGDSDGTPRDCVYVSEQLEDYRTVLAWVRAKENTAFDAGRVVLWGTSFSGGHVVTLAAEQKPNIVCAIAQCAYVGASTKKPFGEALKLVVYGIVDLARQAFGRSPLYIPACALPGAIGIMTAPGVPEGMARITGDKNVSEKRVSLQISASSLFELPFYQPSSAALKIACPLLLIVAEEDSVCMPSAAYSVAEASNKVTLVKTPGGHFDLYPGGPTYDVVLEAELQFLRQHTGVQ
ncbi:hypothetical protein M0805_002355 [Coniferiporia weirii]|nr:hypothetical protein M0805_002355 [Coniferiporia weirii]